MAKTETETPSTSQWVECQVVHRNERRIRVYVPKLADDSEYASRLQQLVSSLNFVTSVRINPAASSIAVEYEARGVSSSVVQDKVLSCIQLANLSETLLNLDPVANQFSSQVKSGTLAAPTSKPEKVEYQVVHQNERRIRLLVPRLAFDTAYAHKLKSLVSSLDYVTEVHINPTARSIAVEYDYFASEGAIATAQQKLFSAIEQAPLAEIDDSKAPAPVQAQESSHDINYWERLGLPGISLGVAVLAGPLELSIPFLVIGGLIAGAAVPIFSRAIAGIVDDRKLKVDVLDSLWITLQTLQGQYVAPALMIGLLESGEAVRDLTGANSRQTLELLDFSDRYAWAPVADTQAGDKAKEVSDRLVVPTLFLSGSIFAVTGNISGTLAPLQLDFGTGIGIAVPTTILAAVTSLARSGVFIRNGRVLEILARTDTVVFGNPLRPESASVIATLTAQGIETHLLTGDNQQAANEVVRGLHNAGKTVAYVGDGLTDTEALAYELDVSVSFAEGTDIERETADVVLIGDDLRGLIHAINIAKRAMEIVYQNIAIVAVPNVSVVIAGVFFGLDPVAAVIVNNCAALIAEMNGLRSLLGTGVPTPRALSPDKDPQEEGSAILAASNGSHRSLLAAKV